MGEVNSFKNGLKSTCRRLIARQQSRHRTAQLRRRQFVQRAGEPPDETSIDRVPDFWNVHRQFNPFSVRSELDYYARSVENALSNDSFRPLPALRVQVPKGSGNGKRDVEIFSVVDRAVSNLYFNRLYQRNRERFHPAVMGYRPDYQVQDAIRYLNESLEPDNSYFVLTCDFEAFFDNISHGYLRKALSQRFSVSETERAVIDAYLGYRYVKSPENFNDEAQVNRRGVPQGSTLSLFLANVACDQLDHRLAETGVHFVRYADDVVVFSPRRRDLLRCQDHLQWFGDRAGPEINLDKTSDICRMPAGKNCGSSFSFLGHEIRPPQHPDLKSRTNIGIRPKSITKIKKRVGTIIYHNLLHHPLNYTVAPSRFHGGVDWDLFNCISELRHYLYGPGLTERDVRTAQNSSAENPPPMSSILSFYTAVNRDDVWRNLDRWMFERLFQSHRERRKIIGVPYSQQINYSRNQLKEGTWLQPDKYKNQTSPLLPSFLYGWLYAKKTKRY